VMKTHPRMGYNILHRIEFLEEASQIVLSHHERIDGSGYPLGLTGDSIPLGSRIFAVADTVDAMTCERPYRDALTFEDASAELLRYSGIQFDKQVVEAFHSVPLEFWKQERKIMDQRFLDNDTDFIL
jgi:HD-GYP domain-containing protein (c-di-GMP phosphodiesterase class II)